MSLINPILVRSSLCGLLAAVTLLSDAASDELFEKRIRPVLAAKCWSCHGSELQQSGLRLDSREAVFKGGGRGPAIVPGDSAGSLLVRALRHEGLEMPLGGMLPKEQIADFAKWIEDGAVWPSESGSTGEADRKHWAFEPVRDQAVPAVSDAGWALNEIDAFLASRLEAEGLKPAPQADRRTLIRRLSFDLTGLPPRPERIHAFVHSKSPTAYLDAVNRLLDSDRFGEHWARHWMDWVRYSESHGSQGDFALPMAWRYRDYLIRAFNSDVPYDQMLLEYLAGDLLERPRLNEQEGLNESMLGPGNLRMVEYGYVPVDALDDQVKVVDNQIDVLSKAFQGLTISCARCHDHKFDPITQKDFYALYGVLASSRHGLVTVDSPEILSKGRDRMEKLRLETKAGLSEAWTKEKGAVAQVLKQVRTGSSDEDPRLEKLKQRLTGETVNDGLQPWQVLQGLEGEAFRREWGYLRELWLGEAESRRARNLNGFRTAWDLTDSGDYGNWFPNGPGAPAKVSPNGEFRVLPEGDEIIGELLPAGVHTALDSRKYGAIVGSPRFRVSSDYISVRVIGDNFPSARLVVENYPIGGGGIHPAVNVEGDGPRWIRFDTAYRKGDSAHLEFQTLDERSRPFWFNPKKPERKASDDGRSSFGVVEVVFHDDEESPRDLPLAILHVLDREPPQNIEDLEVLYDRLIRDAAGDWSNAVLGDRQTAFLDFAIRAGLVPTTLEELTGLRSYVEEYRRLEGAIPIPRRAPGVLPGTNFDQPLLTRGDHKSPEDPVERRYLELFGAEPFRTTGSGRLELARKLVGADNPLTARVMVNRLWSYVFGQGIVPTVDNFGAVGDEPSHPALLDFLAKRFVNGGWSIKETIRFLVLSRTYQMSSAGSAEAVAVDPGNRLLQHQNFRRLPAESIRDAILEISGEIDTTMYGPSINVYYVGKTEGGGKKGPLDGSGRRSVYQGVRRNSQNPFLEVFDAPKPSTTRGKRDVTNIPAQSLAMLNDPFVVDQAAKWANKALADGAISPNDRAVRMFRRALGRDPEAAELDLLMTSVESFAQERGIPEAEMMGDQDLWKDYAQSLLNLKEFIYLR
jgi:hypothetical protein